MALTLPEQWKRESTGWASWQSGSHCSLSPQPHGHREQLCSCCFSRSSIIPSRTPPRHHFLLSLTEGPRTAHWRSSDVNRMDSQTWPYSLCSTCMNLPEIQGTCCALWLCSVAVLWGCGSWRLLEQCFIEGEGLSHRTLGAQHKTDV